MESLTTILAISLFAMVVLQFAFWGAVVARRWRLDHRQFVLQQQWLRRQIEVVERAQQPVDPAAWQGFRRFVVQRVWREANECVSLELVPEDGRPLPFYQPGQHITLRVVIPGQKQPLIRCYSLSAAPHREHYQITVRAVASSQQGSASRAAGLVSNYLVHELSAGTTIDVKAPAGSFYLNLNDRRPVVLLAAGIGITPMMSMLRTLSDHRIHRDVLLIYGVANSAQHTFRDALSKIAHDHPQIDVVTCYSRPLPYDQLGQDYQIVGRITADDVRRFVPTPQLPFYLCGPAGFMQDLYAGLRQWGVLESNIFFEAFGPASIQKTTLVASASADTIAHRVTFQKSDQVGNREGAAQTVLEVADRTGVSIPSGCRAGNCGTCQVRILAGKTAYPEHISTVDCEPGHVLSCVARPLTDIVIDA